MNGFIDVDILLSTYGVLHVHSLVRIHTIYSGCVHTSLSVHGVCVCASITQCD